MFDVLIMHSDFGGWEVVTSAKDCIPLVFGSGMWEAALQYVQTAMGKFTPDQFMTWLSVTYPDVDTGAIRDTVYACVGRGA